MQNSSQNPKPTCRTCDYLQLVPHFEKQFGAEGGECRRNPPVVSWLPAAGGPVLLNPNGPGTPDPSQPTMKMSFPVVTVDTWCGCHRPRHKVS
jgi:hypothetical protein